MQSPNFGPRRDGLKPTLVVLHYTAMASAEDAIHRLCDPQAEVSAHYVIARDGTITQLVSEEMRAWHAGAGEWCGQDDINSRSIGIELDNDGVAPFSEPLMASLERLMPGILSRWAIPLTGVIGHSDMAPGRKIDPGPRFDWRRLQHAELAAWPDVDPVSHLFEKTAQSTEIEQLLGAVGYGSDGSLMTKLTAFRERFLPRSSGLPNAADRLVLLQYLNDYPIDPTQVRA